MRTARSDAPLQHAHARTKPVEVLTCSESSSSCPLVTNLGFVGTCQGHSFIFVYIGTLLTHLLFSSSPSVGGLHTHRGQLQWVTLIFLKNASNLGGVCFRVLPITRRIAKSRLVGSEVVSLSSWVVK